MSGADRCDGWQRTCTNPVGMSVPSYDWLRLPRECSARSLSMSEYARVASNTPASGVAMALATALLSLLGLFAFA